MSNNSPLISMGLPVYNGENFVEEAISSVLAQTYENFELIISDNASTDSTPDICHRYAAKDRRIRYYRNEVNIGAAKNFNRVFELSSGKYFKWCPHDESIKPTFLERCFEALERDPGAVLAFTQCDQRNEFTNTMKTITVERTLDSPLVHERLRQLFLQVINNIVDPIWGLMRSSALRKTTLIRPFPGSDECLLVQLILQGKWIEVPEYLLLLRTHPEGFHAMSQGRKWWEAKKIKAEGIKQAQWFDPDNKKNIYFPYWKRFKEYFAHVTHYDGKLSDKMRMLWFLTVLAAYRRRPLSVELWNGITHILQQTQVLFQKRSFTSTK